MTIGQKHIKFWRIQWNNGQNYQKTKGRLTGRRGTLGMGKVRKCQNDLVVIQTVEGEDFHIQKIQNI